MSLWGDCGQAHPRQELQQPSMNSLEIEQEITKMARAMMIRNPQIGQTLIAHLRHQLTLDEVAGLLLVSLERLLWFDAEAVIWAVENIIPADVMRQIHNITSVKIYKQLIRKGYVPGKDMSVNANGKLLLKEKLRRAA